MTVYVDLSKSSPESIVDMLKLASLQSEKSKAMWIVTYENNEGEFSECFSDKKIAIKYMEGVLSFEKTKYAHIRECVR